MAMQARQVLYVQDPCDSRWSVVLQGRTTCIGDHIDGSIVDVSEMPLFYQQMPFLNGEDEKDDVHANRNNHDEGLWENIPTQLVMNKVMSITHLIIVIHLCISIFSR